MRQPGASYLECQRKEGGTYATKHCKYVYNWLPGITSQTIGVLQVVYVGFKGEYSERRRQAVEAVYEARPVPQDHKVPGDEQGASFNLGM